MEPTIASDLDRHLLQGETIVWSGNPSTGLLFTREDWQRIPLALFFGGVSGFIFFSSVVAWLSEPEQNSSLLYAVLLMTLFMLFTAYITVGRFWFDAWLRRRTHYAVTNKRILISRSGPLGELIALNIKQLPEVKLIEAAEGRGTIRFGHTVSLSQQAGGYDFTWTPSLEPTPQFLSIEDARIVFGEIQRRAQEICNSSDTQLLGR